jgi:ABC-type branched-subunit amino acid transport system ATPase component/MFS family permease
MKVVPRGPAKAAAEGTADSVPLEDLERTAEVAGMAAAVASAPPGGGPWYKRLSPRRITGAAPLFPLAVLFGLNAVDELDRTAFQVLTPEIRDAFGLSLFGVAILTVAVLPVALLVELPVAYFADRRNRTRMAAGGAALWAGFTLLTGVAGLAASLTLLYVARGGSALGKTFNATHNSLLADYYPQEARARVFYAHRLANSVGQFVGPLAAGLLAAVFTWETPFFVLALPTVVFVFLALRLREPTRGVHERRAAGADAATAEIEEVPAGFTETFRTLFASQSARRIYLSLPFFTASFLGLTSLLSLFYEEVYNVGSAGRGVIFAMTEPAQIIGLVVGAVVVQRVMSRDPGATMRLLGLSAIGSGICMAAIALSPAIGVAIGGHIVDAVLRSMLVPGIFAVISLAVPARMRTLGFATGSLWVLLGLPILPIIGAFGDRYGLRVAILLLIPVYLAGSFLLASAGPSLNADIERQNLSSRTQAEIRRRRLEGDPQVLVVRDLDVGYDGTQVLFGVDLEVADGEIVALLGTNGAGKSTLLRAISGLERSTAGAIIFDGRDISGADAVQTASLGMTQVPGDRGTFPTLTVAENLRLAGWLHRKDPDHVAAATEAVLGHFPVLRERSHLPAGSLSGGEQQMLSLAQAFIAKPKLLMIDELSLGLSPTVVARLLSILPAIQAQGTAILLVEQSVNTALQAADRAVFLEKGSVRFTGPTTELLERTDILRSVFLHGAAAAIGGNGRAPAAARRSDSTGEAEPVLEVEGLVKRYGGIRAVNEVSFTLREGEVLGLIGPNGAGKTTIFDLISGFQRADGGRVVLEGVDVTSASAHARARLGLGRSFQSARLWPSLTVREALATGLEASVDVRAALPAMLNLPLVKDSEERVQDRVEELLSLLGIEAWGDRFVSELSTGVRRMVDLGVQLANEPSVLLLDEPSSGIASKETEALGPTLKAVQAHLGCSLLIIEHDMPLVRSLADRLVALDAGAVVAEGRPDDVLAHPRVVESYLGEGWVGT